MSGPCAVCNGDLDKPSPYMKPVVIAHPAPSDKATVTLLDGRNVHAFCVPKAMLTGEADDDDWRMVR